MESMDMTIFMALVGLSIVGIAVTFWLQRKERDSVVPSLPALDLNEEAVQIHIPVEPPTEEGEGPPASSRKSPFSILSGIFQKIQFGKKPPPEEKVLEQPPLPSLKDYLAKETIPLIKRPTTGTASITTNAEETTAKENLVSATEEKTIEKEIHLSDQLNDLKEKYQNLEKLFNEKSTSLEKAEESLGNELKNRKEFNKVKDLLEKELKETKDKARNAQVELNSARAEGESYKKRINQLEEKVTKLEKGILQKEQEVDNLRKRLQTFASPKPEATPPTPQKTAEPALPSQETTTDKQPPPLAEQPLEQEKSGAPERPPQPEVPPHDTQESDKPTAPDIQTKESQEQVDPPADAEETAPETEFLKLQPDIMSESDKEKKIIEIIDPQQQKSDDQEKRPSI